MWILFLFRDVSFQAAFQPKISYTNCLLWYSRCHCEFPGYFQENKWRISDNLVVLTAAAVCIQSYAHLPGKRDGILWEWKQQPCRRQCTVWITCFNTWRKGKLCLRKMPGRTVVQLLLWTAQVIKLCKGIDWHMFHQALALQSLSN